jgi:hypothetical protein
MRASVLLTLLAVGCAPVVQSTYFTSSPPAHAPATAQVRVYAETRPRCPIEELGALQASPRSPRQGLDDLVARMRDRARAMGGEAIVGFQTQEVPQENTTLTVAKGTVVRFTDRGCLE